MEIYDATEPPMDYCLQNRKWWMFLLSSIFSYFVGIFVILLCRAFSFVCFDKKPRDVHEKNDFEATNWAGKLISGQTMIGRILMVLIFMLNIASLFIYFNDASDEFVERCQKWSENTNQQIDFALNICFMFFFFLRLIAATDKFWFMFEIFSIVDCFTIPPSFVSIYLNRTWIGLRSLRVLYILKSADILKYLNIIKTSTTIRLAQRVSTFMAVWFTAAGIIHLLENSGDPLEFNNSQLISYWSCLYFLIVTMSTVGYGDFYCATQFGRAFIMFFLFFELVIVANLSLEIFRLIEAITKKGRKTKNKKRRKLPSTRYHAVTTSHASTAEENRECLLQSPRQSQKLNQSSKDHFSTLHDLKNEFSSISNIQETLNHFAMFIQDLKLETNHDKRISILIKYCDVDFTK